MINLKRHLLGAVLVLCFLPASGRSQEEGGIVGFYPSADSICTYPTLDRPLAVICRKKLLGRYVTFIGYKDTKKVFMASVTLKPVMNPDSEISRVVAFDGIKPTLGKVETWGYVFDRNGDGKIDYLALVEGAGAFEDDDLPDDYPVRGQPLNRPELEVYVGHCRLIFNHWADDNYDGTIDAGIICDADSMRDWIARRIVVRSTKFNGTFDDVWGFKTNITARRDSIGHDPTSVPYHALGKFWARIDKAVLQEKTGVLQLLNRAAKECGILKPAD